MSRKLATLALIFLIVAVASAQDDTTTAPAADTGSNYTGFVVICEDQAVVNLDGTMLAGFDLYFQIYAGTQGTDGAISSLRRVAADGTFTFSEVVPYNGDTTIPFGGFGSAFVSIAREGDPDNSTFSEFIDDFQDGCAEPQNPVGVSSVEGDGAFSATSGSDVLDQSAGTKADGTSNILSPFGGVLNPNYIPPEKPFVVLGAREPFTLPRQETPGLIFAECQDYPVAEPGLIYDNDDVVVFWSWFARTRQQAQDHIDHVQYAITNYGSVTLPNVQVSDIQLINGRYWVFYTSRLGNLRAGQYYIDYNVTWDEAITDGFADYGPETDNELLESGCYFEVRQNPDGIQVPHSPWPRSN